MKTIRLILVFTQLLYLSTTMEAQVSKLGNKNIDIEIYTSFLEKTVLATKSFLQINNADIIKQNESKSQFQVEFYLTETKVKDLNDLTATLGFIAKNEISSKNFEKEMKQLELEKKHLENKKSEYQKELNTITQKDDRYYRFWEELRVIENQLYDIEKELLNYQTENVVTVQLTLFDETYDSYERTINWVNMPGVSADFLITESPRPDQSAQQYMGYQLKYMFTKGKSYANLGAFKEFSDEPVDSMRFKELFVVGFGQDFYSKYFGRGKNKFLNLYTGYNIGGIFATGEQKKATFGYLTPFFGIELFKNKYILFDTRVGYFIPFNYNRNLRGVHYSISFNFVF